MKKVIVLAGILLLNGCASIQYSCTGDDKNSSGCSSLSEVANNLGAVETPVAIETDVISRKAALKKTAKRFTRNTTSRFSKGQCW